MGILSSIFGNGDERSNARSPMSQPRPAPGSQRGAPPAPSGAAASANDQALARYRYLLRTAPPEAIEQAHAEAFAQLTPQQRTQALRELSRDLPESERNAVPTDAQPQSLARMATRAEMRRPGTLERAFGGGGFGGVMAGSLLGSIAGSFIGTAIAHQFLDGFDGFGWNEPGDMDVAEGSDTGMDDSFGDGFGDDMLDV